MIPIGITRDGALRSQPDDPEQFALNPAAMPTVIDNGTRVHLAGVGGDARAHA